MIEEEAHKVSGLTDQISEFLGGKADKVETEGDFYDQETAQ
jgi:hypothetical protein